MRPQSPYWLLVLLAAGPFIIAWWIVGCAMEVMG